MRDDTWRKLDSIFLQYPMLRAEGVSVEEIQTASRSIGLPFPESYRDFLARYGAAIVGPYPIYGLREVEPMGDVGSVVDVNFDVRQEWPHLVGWLIISNDLAGNPIGLQSDGSVWLADHEFGENVLQAKEFEDFLREKCLRL